MILKCLSVYGKNTLEKYVKMDYAVQMMILRECLHWARLSANDLYVFINILLKVFLMYFCLFQCFCCFSFESNVCLCIL